MNPIASLFFRKNYMTLLLSLVLTLGVAGPVSGQSEGDYRSRQTGNWNVAASWQIFTNGNWTDATGTPDHTAGLITILSNDTITVTANVTVDRLVIDLGGTVRIGPSDNLSMDVVNTSSYVTVNGRIIFTGENYISGAGTFTLAPGGTIEIGSANGITTTTTNGNLRNTTKSLSPAAHYIYNGTVFQIIGNAYPNNLTGSLTIDNSSGAEIKERKAITNTGRLNLVNGNFTLPPIAGASAFTLKDNASLYRSGGSLSDNLGSGVYHVFYQGESKTTTGELSGSGLNNVTINLEPGEILTLDRNRSPNGNLTINSGIFDISTYTFDRQVSGGGSMTLADGTVLRLGGSSNFPLNFSYVLNPGSTVEYNALGTQTVFSNVTYSNLTLSGSGIKQFLVKITINDNLSIEGNGETQAIINDGVQCETGSLIINDYYQQPGIWGGSTSSARWKSATYFGSSTTGTLLVQASCTPGRWFGNTSSDWGNGDNWCGGTVPTSSVNVVIPSLSQNYPVISGSTAAICNNITIESGASLTIQPGGRATVHGSMTVADGADFTIQSSSIQEGMLMFNSATKTGDVNVELFLPGGSGYHYFVPPVASMAIGSDVTSARAALGLTSANFNGDLVLYDGSKALTSMGQGWQYFDGYNSTTGFSSLTSGRGYNIYLRSDGTLTFNGILNSSDHTFDIDYVANTDDWSGWNLVGNPYPVNYNLTGIEELNSLVDDGISNTIYYTYNGSFEYYNPLSEQGSSNATSIIRPMQGFFVYATEAGSLTLPVGSKTFNPAQQRFKKGSSADGKKTPLKLARLTLNSGSEADETLILLVEGSTNEFNESYDGFKLLSGSSSKPFIYSKLNGVDYFMKAVACPGTNSVVVPLELIIKETGDHSINVTELENMEGYNVILRHGNVEVPLTNNSTYTINLTAGTYSDFELEFKMITTDVETTELSELKTWYSNNYLYIRFPSNLQSVKGQLAVFDFYGRQVYRDNNLQVVPEQTIQIPVNFQKGLYFIDLNVDLRRFKSKIVAY